MTDFFPRTPNLPPHSPLFWVNHKDRYLRQLLIKDIEAATSRRLIVYHTDCDRSNAQIDPSDDVALAELLTSCKNLPVDLMIETNGGFTDSTEKLCAMLKSQATDLRVIVPRKAKSNGTVIALCGSSILMGAESELGPIDPAIQTVPAEFIVNAPAGSFNVIDVQYATYAQNQTRKLATYLLTEGMMKSAAPQAIEETVNALATKQVYHSHGSSIDAAEAKRLGLNVILHEPDDELWCKVWLLRTMYQYDCGVRNFAKLFESSTVSTAVPK